MPVKKYMLNEQIPISIYKIRASKFLRLSIKPDGTVRLSMPYWMPYSAGIKYAKTKQAWIKKHHKPLKVLGDGDVIGKYHTIKIIYVDEENYCRTGLKDNTVIVKLGKANQINDNDVQKKIHSASIKALRLQAEQYLPKRLNEYAKLNRISANSISIKNLKGRWGSCDINQNIILNLHLMHLPWDLIDYVIHHELTHIKVMKHGPDFWSEMEHIWPEVNKHKKEIKNYHPNFTNY